MLNISALILPFLIGATTPIGWAICLMGLGIGAIGYLEYLVISSGDGNTLKSLQSRL